MTAKKTDAPKNRVPRRVDAPLPRSKAGATAR
jgi:hypothetical protein